MKETNWLINVSSILAIISGIALTYITLSKGTTVIDCNFFLYFIAQFTWIFGILTLFRESRSKK
jgi:hypothetical protein